MRKTSRTAAALFATTVTLVGGVGTYLMIVFSSADDVTMPLLVMAGSLAGFGLFVWLLRDRPQRYARETNLYYAEKEKLDKFLNKFQPKLSRRHGRDVGTNRPPTAEQIRQIRDDSNAWIPSHERVEQYRKTLEQS